MAPAPGTPEETSRRRIRSLALRVMVFLLLGAVVNVAVAWGFFLWHPGHAQYDVLDELTSTEIWDRFGGPVRVAARNGGGVERIRRWATCYEAHAKHFAERASYEVVEIGAGWPLSSLVGQIWEEPLTTLWLFDALRFRMLRSNDFVASTNRFCALPSFPLWPGFAINTLFYATILWLLFAFPFALRRWRRIRRGLCAKCAYPVGASDVCTECGAVVRPSGAAECSHG